MCTKPYIYLHEIHVRIHILNRDTWSKLRPRGGRKWQERFRCCLYVCPSQKHMKSNIFKELVAERTGIMGKKENYIQKFEHSSPSD